MCKVHNKHHNTASKDAVYIGRPSKWGNPFVVGAKYARGEAVVAHKEWLLKQPHLIKQIKEELKGKDLVCFCKPKACHGDILLEIANGDKL